jgi:hypothetical protein
VSVSWTGSTYAGGVDHYEIQRRFNRGSYTLIGTSTTTSYTDSGTAGVTYLYRVYAVGSDNHYSASSTIDLATTIIYTDDPLTPGTTVIKAQHLTELRSAVNAVRATAGLSAATWTDPSLSGVIVKAVHLQEIRANLTAGLTALGFSAPSYTDTTLTVGVTVVKEIHVDEIRQSMK